MNVAKQRQICWNNVQETNSMLKRTSSALHDWLRFFLVFSFLRWCSTLMMFERYTEQREHAIFDPIIDCIARCIWRTHFHQCHQAMVSRNGYILVLIQRPCRIENSDFDTDSFFSSVLFWRAPRSQPCCFPYNHIPSRFWNLNNIILPKSLKKLQTTRDWVPDWTRPAALLSAWFILSNFN